MKTEFSSWYSASLSQEMALKKYGYYGKPVLVFPAQAGRFYDFENFGMVEAIESQIESGRIKLFCVDSVDAQSWSNWDAHPSDRAGRHQEYDRYIIEEVAPFIRSHCGTANRSLLQLGPVWVDIMLRISFSGIRISSMVLLRSVESTV
jgi:esterase/lipase superfamily enzyme